MYSQQQLERAIKDAIRSAYDKGYSDGKDDGRLNSGCSRYVGGNVEIDTGNKLIFTVKNIAKQRLTTIRDRMMDAAAEALGDAYDCLRVWSAWGVGTMGQDDFSLVAGDPSRLGEIVDAVTNVITAEDEKESEVTV